MPKTQWLDQIATLSGFRDREVLDISLASALRDLLQSQRLTVWRCVGQNGDERWLMRAQLGLNDMAARSDPVGTCLEDLPPLLSQPERAQCLRQRSVMQSADLSGGVCIRFPLASDRDLVGVLELHTLQELTLTEQRMVGSVLRLYGNVLGLLDYSERDTLTGLLNRKTFDDGFLQMAGLPVSSPGQVDIVPPTASARRPVPLHTTCLGVIDIDHFKRVNDSHGHLIGDEVLLLLSRLMRNAFRFDDRLYRFGGEEFVVLMRCENDADAMRALERMRGHVQAFDFPRVGKVTVSIGVTEVRPGDTPSMAFERADQAVYYAKQNGRNQTQDHATLVAAGCLKDSQRDSDVEMF